ncbi:MAG: preprotein translocase subunit Sec61beta [Nanoarchaeota archaeon]
MAEQSSGGVPSAFGGIVRYDSEYKSRLTISPVQVIVFIVLVVIFVLALKMFWPVAV